MKLIGMVSLALIESGRVNKLAPSGVLFWTRLVCEENFAWEESHFSPRQVQVIHDHLNGYMKDLSSNQVSMSKCSLSHISH